jgi:hypothetical protein
VIATAAQDLWHLCLGDQLIAIIKRDDYETPWTHGHLVDADRFETDRTFFCDDSTWPVSQDFEEMLATIRSAGGFFLLDVRSGQRFYAITLNCDADRVWFRF